MNQRLFSVLIFAFVVSAGASLLLYRLIASRVTKANSEPAAQVLVAARNLDLGTLLRESDLKMGGWNGPLPQGALLRKEDVVGRGVMAAIYDGEPIVENRLAPKGAGAGLAATIPAGMRAVAVKVNDVVGVAGFVVPGMRVDVLISGNPPGGAASTGMVSKTLLQNIEVLSAGQNFQKDAEGKPVQVQVVNLLVTPEQAEVVNLASNETKIQLVLRNPLDTQTAKTTGIAMVTLFGGAVKPPEPARAPRRIAARVTMPAPIFIEAPKPAGPVMVEVINGTKRMESKFTAPSEGVQ
ncbi:MAG TPA: Flp pilus assembly protein CpaB [Bryobacteraceae bacterium]|nr:Flp pilus assembly protein CpaB [Bryobacteraceae bacterium]HXJ42101.1 Flp pilus assembly protein CpaB [Bryobacteraceae bacterium]